MRKAIIFSLCGLALLGAQPAMAAGIGHSIFMRGQIVDTDSTGTVVCLGSEDGAEVGQVLAAYRVKVSPSNGKTPGVNYSRSLIGHVKIDHIFDGHFAHVVVTDGKPARNDIVELKN